MQKKVQTDFLFAQPSFASGVGRVVDLWGAFDDYNISATPVEADERAIAADWLVVGQDIADVIDQNESDLKVAQYTRVSKRHGHRDRAEILRPITL